jgi:hypothetical protein
VTKPNLFIVGAPKCGTTAWYEYLRGHPDVFFPAMKEPHHFLHDFPGYPQVTDRDEYLALFADGGDHAIVGEASPHYLYSETAAERLFGFNPDARILIFVRDHADYLQSLFNQYLYNGMECLRDFRVAWTLSGERHSGNIPAHFTEPAMLDYRKAATFFPQVERYFDLFPAERVRVFHMRDWVGNPRRTYVEILTLLGLEDDGRTNFPRVNEAHHHRFNAVMKLVQDPPNPLKRLVEAGRRMSGREGLGLGKFLYRLNRRPGRIVEIDAAMRGEIEAYYVEDAKRLQPRLWRPAEA